MSGLRDWAVWALWRELRVEKRVVSWDWRVVRVGVRVWVEVWIFWRVFWVVWIVWVRVWIWMSILNHLGLHHADVLFQHPLF